MIYPIQTDHTAVIEAVEPIAPDRSPATGDRVSGLFGTKAETLTRLRPLLKTCAVLDMHYFTVADWRQWKQEIIRTIMARFSDSHLVVRSSAYNEDTSDRSMAGAYDSRLNVAPTAQAIHEAVEEVTSSYDDDPRDQVLVQPMLDNVTLSGVIMTHDLQTGAPYFVVNYDDESGKTDAVTGGTGVNKTLVIHHGYDPDHVRSPRMIRLLDMVHELRGIFGPDEPLDIEFAATGNTLYLLQLLSLIHI